MMPIVNVNLILDDNIYSGVMSGAYELCGMVKNVDNRRVVKHLPTVIDSAKEGATKAIDMIRANSKAFIVAGIVVGAGGLVYGIATHRKNKQKKILQTNFTENMQIYLDTAKNGTLNEDILSSFINSIEELSNSEKDLNLNIPLSQFNALINAIFDFTKQLAEANAINPNTIKKPPIFKKKNFSYLQYYLEVQKNIFINVA